jgi:hypothetical protein
MLRFDVLTRDIHVFLFRDEFVCCEEIDEEGFIFDGGDFGNVRCHHDQVLYNH